MEAIRPQPGPQEAFLSSPATIVIYGGAVGGGKTYGLTLEAMRHSDIEGFNAIVFRRLSTQLTGGGSIWQETFKLYPMIGGVPREGAHLDWRFPSGATIQFAHLQYLKDTGSHLSKQYALILWDQLEQFEEAMFWALYGRNRSVCGVAPYIRAACNPDPDCFLYRDGNGLIAWWIDEDGYAIEERSGVLRWFVRGSDDVLIWADSREELAEKVPEIAKRTPAALTSLTFIAAKLEDNPILMEKDPGYEGKLANLPKVQRLRLRYGNWKIRATAGTMFRRDWYEIVPARPKKPLMRVRAWDLAATEPHQANPNPAYTAGVRYSRAQDGTFYVEDMVRFQKGPAGVEKAIVAAAERDGDIDAATIQAVWRDPGGAGKHTADRFSRLLAHHQVHIETAKEDKVTYAEPVSSQCEQGNVKLVRGDWNEEYIAEHEAFPDAAKKDQVDATSLAHLVCTTDDITMLLMLSKR